MCVCMCVCVCVQGLSREYIYVWVKYDEERGFCVFYG